LILRKIIKIAATRCHILKLKCTKLDFPRWGSLQRSPAPIAGFRGLLLRERGGEGRGGEGEEGKGWEGRGEEGGQRMTGGGTGRERGGREWREREKGSERDRGRGRRGRRMGIAHPVPTIFRLKVAL